MIAPCTALVLGACSKQEVAVKAAGNSYEQLVEVVPLERRNLIEHLTLVGSLAARESAEIRAQTAGVVTEIAFTEGSEVEAGQVLLRIDDSEVLAQLHEVEAELEVAQSSFQRMTLLGQQNTIPQADIDAARARMLSAKARVELQRSRLDKTVVRAPFSGVAGGRDISPGDYVSIQTVITTIEDVSKLKIEFDVPEAFQRKVQPGTVFKVSSRAVDHMTPVGGQVYFVSPGIDRDTRSTRVKGWLDATLPGLKPGMFANVELVLAVRPDALVVPESALLVTREGMRITVVEQKGDQQVAKFVPVAAGLRSDGLVEVIPGAEVTAGQPVVASGVGAVNIAAGKALKTIPLRDELRPDAVAVD